jgi:hypothetical protein
MSNVLAADFCLASKSYKAKLKFSRKIESTCFKAKPLLSRFDKLFLSRLLQA